MANVIKIKRSDLTAAPSTLEAGELAYSSVSDSLYVGHPSNTAGSVVVAIAGKFLVDEVNAIEGSLGSFVNADGSFNASALNALGNVAATTSLMDTLSQMDSAISDALEFTDVAVEDLNNVTITAAADNDFLMYQTGQWVDRTPAQVVTTLGLDIGVDVQAYDATLQSISSLGTVADKMMYTTGVDTWAETPITAYGRSLLDDADAATARGTLDVYSVAEVDALVDTKDQLSELDDVTITAAADGDFLRHNGVAWVDHVPVLTDISDITASAAELNIMDGVTSTTAELNILDGVTASALEINTLDGITALTADLNLLAGADAAGLTNAELLTLNGITATTAELNVLAGIAAGLTATELSYMDGVTSGVQAQINSKIGRAGDSMDSAANLTFSGNGEVLGLPAAPSGATAAASKAYVDNLISGGASWRNPVVDADLVDVVGVNPATPEATYSLSVGDSVAFIATAAITFSLGTGTTVVGTQAGDIVNLTITSSGNGDYNLIETPLSTGDRFIISAEHGTIGSGLSGITMPDTFALANGDLIEYTGTGDGSTVSSWTTPEGRSGQAGGGTEIAQGTTVLNSDPDSVHYGHTFLYNADTNTWAEISGPGSIGAGIGLAYVGNNLNINMGAGIVALPSDEVGIDLYAPTSGALFMTEDGSTDSTGSAAKLHLQIAGTTLTQDGTGLYVPADGITRTEINADIAGLGLSQAAGGELDVNVDDSSIEINVDTLRVKAAGVTNAMLANPAITMAGDTGSDDVNLGETFTFTGGEGIDTAMVANVLTISAEDATDVNKGVASFNSGHFSVTAGAVSLDASLADINNVGASADAASDGDALSWNNSAGEWQAGYVLDGGTF